MDWLPKQSEEIFCYSGSKHLKFTNLKNLRDCFRIWIPGHERGRSVVTLVTTRLLRCPSDFLWVLTIPFYQCFWKKSINSVLLYIDIMDMLFMCIKFMIVSERYRRNTQTLKYIFWIVVTLFIALCYQRSNMKALFHNGYDCTWEGKG